MKDSNTYTGQEFFLKKYGGLGSELGRGREKTARKVGEDKVLIEYHGDENKMLATAEYVTAQYYMQKVLHLLLPNNFLRVFAAGANSILVEKAPDTEDFLKAKELNKLFIDPSLHHTITPEQKMWMEQKASAMLTDNEFSFVIEILQEIGLGYGKDEAPSELALPVNTVRVNDHPVLIEMMKPIVTNDHGQAVPRLQVNKLQALVEDGVTQQAIPPDIGARIIRLAERYQIKALEAAKQADEKSLTVY